VSEKQKILVVDDDPDNIETLRELLEVRGYDIQAACNGEEALRIVAGTRVDAILLDIVMPGMDGLNVKAKLNENSQSATIPVIFVTAKDAVPDKVRGLGVGADDYITKPFHAEELLARVRAALNRRGVYEQISMTDGLTGLYNTAFFNKQFALFFGMGKRYKKIFSLALIDLNNFKEINDTYGHAAGDFVLKNFASIARAALRQVDIVTRYGGDEFAIIMPEVNLAQASVAVDRLRKNITARVLNFHGAPAGIAFSISVGVASYDDSFTGESKMFELADSRLYEDKRSKGRY
jgi:two-component system, cell cycle response regulator